MLAAGRGTRMAGFGGEAKELLPLGDRSCLDRVLDEAFSVSPAVVVVTSEAKPSVASRALERGARVAFQREPNGVVDAVLSADPVGDVLVLLGDCAFPSDSPSPRLASALGTHDGAVAFVTTDDAGTSVYGIGEVSDGTLTSLTEKPGPSAASRLAVAGRYALSASLLDEVRARHRAGLGADFPLTALLGEFVRQGRRIAAVEVVGPRGDVGSPREYAEAQALPW